MCDPIRYDNIRVQRDGAVVVLELARPDIRNAFTDAEMCGEIASALEWVEAEDVSVLILTGEGSAFSAGGNVKAMVRREGIFGGSPAEIHHGYRAGVQRVIKLLWNLQAVTIAAVNGPAIGAGCDLALACDLRLGSSRARFGETFVTLGLISGDGGAYLLPRAVGWQRAAEMTFTGRIVDAAEALSYGLLLETTAPEDLLTRARELAATIAGMPATALRLNKRLLRRAQNATLEEVLELAAPFQGICHHTGEHHDLVQAMQERLEGRAGG
jgi:enoyl-CoA hydratase/carnithine racemase